MLETDYFIGLDLGTSAIKGVLIDGAGKIYSEQSKAVNIIRTDNNHCEINPDEHYAGVCEVIKKLADKVDGKVMALSIAGASGNTLLADKDGKALTKIISWLDTRDIKLPDSLSHLTADDMREIVGWPLLNVFSLAHIAWFKEHQTKLFNNANKICMNTDWLLYQLSGKWLMDYSTATTFHMQDQKKLSYYQPFLDAFEIDKDKLPTLVESGSLVGNLTDKALLDTGLSKGTKIVTGCFDHPAAARCMGILEPGQLMISCGTSWVGFFPELKREKIIDAQILCDPFISFKQGPWGGIFAISNIDENINWYVDNVIAPNQEDKYKLFDELSEKSVKGAGGLKIDMHQTPKKIDAPLEHISRAVMEGVVEIYNDFLNDLKEKGFNFTQTVMVGGPTRSKIWTEILKERTGLDIIVGSPSAGAKGAAMLAGIGVGYFKDEYDAYEKAGENNGN